MILVKMYKSCNQKCLNFNFYGSQDIAVIFEV